MAPTFVSWANCGFHRIGTRHAKKNKIFFTERTRSEIKLPSGALLPTANASSPQEQQQQQQQQQQPPCPVPRQPAAQLREKEKNKKNKKHRKNTGGEGIRATNNKQTNGKTSTGGPIKREKENKKKKRRKTQKNTGGEGIRATNSKRNNENIHRQ
jgi:hypothetical protein